MKLLVALARIMAWMMVGLLAYKMVINVSSDEILIVATNETSEEVEFEVESNGYMNNQKLSMRVFPNSTESYWVDQERRRDKHQNRRAERSRG